jgi:beta-lactam-binding protein with PASTA domain
VAKPVVLSNVMTIIPVVQKENGDSYLPDVRGMSLRKARTVLRQIGLRTFFKGSGKVIWQSPKPGTIVANGSICTIGLK